MNSPGEQLFNLRCNAGHFFRNVLAIRVNQATNLFCWGQPQNLLHFVHFAQKILLYFWLLISKSVLKRTKSFQREGCTGLPNTIYLNLHKCSLWQIPRDWNFTCQRHPFVENQEIQIKPISKPMNRESLVLDA